MPMTPSEVRRFRERQRETPSGVDLRQGFTRSPGFEPARPGRRPAETPDVTTSPPSTATEMGGREHRDDDIIEVGPDLKVRRRKRS